MILFETFRVRGLKAISMLVISKFVGIFNGVAGQDWFAEACHYASIEGDADYHRGEFKPPFLFKYDHFLAYCWDKSQIDAQMDKGMQDCPVEPGYGTYTDHDQRELQESVEYWPQYADADEALRNGGWTQAKGVLV